ncbi:DUF4126 domain-containing protein [Rothia terrae]|uniref:DUF4126 domain-containing protein n=1 Tax=Rothia terrae TaxID=396015 RepID=UPI0033EF6C5C
MVLGFLDRYTQFVNLASGFDWLSNGWVIIILSVLLALEVVADKIPAVDTVNDFIQTIVRPTSGGIVFGSTAVSNIAGFSVGGSDTVTDPEAYVQSGAWVAIVVGIIIALLVHLFKMTTRPLINGATVGVGAPVVSTAEDATSVLLSIAAIFLPILAALILVAIAIPVTMAVSRIRARKKRSQAVTTY